VETVLSAGDRRRLSRLHHTLRRRAAGALVGDYRSAFRGRGLEFEEVRPYAVGDDVRAIDWNVTARAGRPYVKVFREERQLTLLIVLDLSGSMQAGGHTGSRLQLAARMAAGLAHAAALAGDRVGLLAFSDRTERLLPPRAGRGHAWAVLRAALLAPPPRRRTDLTGALTRAGRLLHQRGLVCVLSDFIDPGPWDRALARLAHQHTVSVLVLGEAKDTALPDVGLVTVIDAETSKRRVIDAGRLRPRGSGRSAPDRLLRARRAGARAEQVSLLEDPIDALLGHFRRLPSATAR